MLIYVADRNKDKQENAPICSPGEKKKPQKQNKKQTKTISSFIKVELAGNILIHHVNKITGRFSAGFSPGRI